jgi:hypothetical protein
MRLLALLPWFALSVPLLSVLPASAQELELPPLSPRAEVMQQVGIVNITVNYSSPGKRERTVWGELVPYDKLWRTGANSATTFETTGPLVLGSTEVPAGKYSLFSIPGKDEWTIILNKNFEQGGTDDYDQALDVVRLKLKSEQGPARERLTFLFSDTTEQGTRLDLEWDGVHVGIPLIVDTAGMVKKGIDAYVTDASDTLASAARYRAEHGDIAGALALIDASLSVRESWYNTWLKADLLHQKEEHKTAYKLAQRAQELGLAAGDGFFWKDRVEKALAEWKKK